MEGHHPPIQHSKCACKFQCQRTRSPVVYSGSTGGDLWIITSWVLKGTYLSAELHPGSSRVPICLQNLSTHSVEIPTKTVVGQVAPANQVPPVVLPTRTSKESNDKPQKEWVLEVLDHQGLKEWPKLEQKQVRELLFKWEHPFACSNLDLGKTALIKHKIEVTYQTPFEKCY